MANGLYMIPIMTSLSVQLCTPEYIFVGCYNQYRRCIKDFQKVLTRISSKLQGWKSESFSPENINILVISSYLRCQNMSCPHLTFTKLYSLKASIFLCKNEKNSNKTHLVSQNNICSPTSLGDLII